MRRRLSITLAIAVLCLALSSAARAQGHGGGGMGGGGMGHGGMGPGGFGQGRPNALGDNVGLGRGPRMSELALGPAGLWWHDDRFSRLLRIDPTQRKRMDDVLSTNRSVLMSAYKNLQKQENQLARLVRAKDPDEGQIFQQIDRVTQARGDLEKANAHLQLELRKTMTTDQTSRLDELRFSPAPDPAAVQ